jgi:hypothetical protein
VLGGGLRRSRDSRRISPLTGRFIEGRRSPLEKLGMPLVSASEKELGFSLLAYAESENLASDISLRSL